MNTLLGRYNFQFDESEFGTVKHVYLNIRHHKIYKMLNDHQIKEQEIKPVDLNRDKF
jgi:hypothetical protein